MNAPFRAVLLAVVIPRWGLSPALAQTAAAIPFKSLRGRSVKATGIIEMYRDDPEIKILSTDQLVLE
jgi:hypothetical protein